MKIDLDRLLRDVEALSHVGKAEHGGIFRALGDESERQARSFLRELWVRDLHLTPYTDAIADLWADRAGRENLPPIGMGSHHDAVPDGGAYDGALGVLMAGELIRTLNDHGVTTRHPLRLVSFTAEEPNPFNVSTLGSKVLSGRLTRVELEQLRHRDTGESLAAAIGAVGGDLSRVDGARLEPNCLAAFLECHNELGRRLYDKKLPCCAVSTIIGIYREDVTVAGFANHAGTTVMTDRHDALCAAAEFLLDYEAIVGGVENDETVGTVGRLDVTPNETNVIPGGVTLALELRWCDPAVKDRVLRAVDKAQKRIESARGVAIHRRVNLDQPPIPLDDTVQRAVRRGMEQAGAPACTLVSMAGHDAANMQRVCPSGMIFCQSTEGRGHRFDEYCEPEAIAATANAMLAALLILDEELDAK